MLKEPCHYDGDCEFRHKCACSGNQHLLCGVTYQLGGLFFVEKETHPTCNAKTFFGDAHICLCAAKNNTR
ncbi:MAG: hypothetical protein Q7U44_10150 [Desulfuromonadales bacterium]|nr:hypothetical protein [Desulfuromonadales bacterium]